MEGLEHGLRLRQQWCERINAVLGTNFSVRLADSAVIEQPDVSGDNTELLSGQAETVKLLKNKLNQQKLVDLIGVCDTLKEMTNRNCNNSLLITEICCALRSAAGR